MYADLIEAQTPVFAHLPVEGLIRANANGYETPVSGDLLTLEGLK